MESILYHRGRNPRTTSDITLWADDEDSILSYGSTLYTLTSDHVDTIPQWLIDYTAQYYSVDIDTARDLVNPDNIVNDAGCWDDREYVHNLWADNEGILMDMIDHGIYGYKTDDGAVTFAW